MRQNTHSTRTGGSRTRGGARRMLAGAPAVLAALALMGPVTASATGVDDGLWYYSDTGLNVRQLTTVHRMEAV